MSIEEEIEFRETPKDYLEELYMLRSQLTTAQRNLEIYKEVCNQTIEALQNVHMIRTHKVPDDITHIADRLRWIANEALSTAKKRLESINV
jgi:hypothetical protein